VVRHPARRTPRCYKDRWQIKLFFKALKQNLKIKTFVGTSANALKVQVWTALIAMLILKYLQLKARFAWSLSNLVADVRLLQGSHQAVGQVRHRVARARPGRPIRVPVPQQVGGDHPVAGGGQGRDLALPHLVVQAEAVEEYDRRPGAGDQAGGARYGRARRNGSARAWNASGSSSWGV